MTPAPASYLKILLVEPDPRTRENLSHEIVQMGFDVTSVGTAQAARRMLHLKAVDTVIIEPHLPGSDAMELLGCIRRDQPDIQIIVLTAFADLETAKKAVRLEICDFLTKPCPLSEIERALDHARRRAMRIHPRLPQLAELKDDAERSENFTGRLGADAGLKLNELERRYILTVLDMHKGNRAQTAEDLGISLRKLYYRLHQYANSDSAQMVPETH